VFQSRARPAAPVRNGTTLLIPVVRWPGSVRRRIGNCFTYKGRAVDVKQVGRELGVRYVLEGSVRKGGNRVRITAQLIDATNGAHL
jgi:adenylate cyclase